MLKRSGLVGSEIVIDHVLLCYCTVALMIIRNSEFLHDCLRNLMFVIHAIMTPSSALCLGQIFVLELRAEIFVARHTKRFLG